MDKILSNVERRIVRRFVFDVIGAGLFLNVADDDGSLLLKTPTQNKKDILKLICDEQNEWVYLYETNNPPSQFGWARFIHGNGPYILSDYSTSIPESLLQGTFKLVDKYND